MSNKSTRATKSFIQLSCRDGNATMKQSSFKFLPEQLEEERQSRPLLRLLADITKYFNCRRCGKCCDVCSVQLYSTECRHFGESNVAWEADGIVHLKSPCPFYKSENNKILCKTNQYKPVTCKIYPFTHGYEEIGFAISLCEMGQDILCAYESFLRCTGKKPMLDYGGIPAGVYETRYFTYISFDRNIYNMRDFLVWLKTRRDVNKDINNGKDILYFIENLIIRLEEREIKRETNKNA